LLSLTTPPQLAPSSDAEPYGKLRQLVHSANDQLLDTLPSTHANIPRHVLVGDASRAQPEHDAKPFFSLCLFISHF